MVSGFDETPNAVNTKRLILLAVAVAGLTLALRSPFLAGGGSDAVDESGAVMPVNVANSAGRSGAYYVPASAPVEGVPVLFLMHPTGSSGGSFIQGWRSLADSLGFVLIAPDSRVSPTGVVTWQVGDRSGDVTEDLEHALAVLHSVRREALLDIDESRLLIAGFSGGASMAPYIATNRSPFSHAAVLHGRAFIGGLGNRQVPVWISTGDRDEAAPRRESAELARDLEDLGLGVTFSSYPSGHDLSRTEKLALLRWWLGG